MIYLVWERESYCDYDVILITQDKEKAEKLVEIKNKEYECERFSIEEKELDKITEINW